LAFCSKCGNEETSDKKFCSKCGSELEIASRQPTRETSRSNLWYLLSIILGLVGGIIAFFVLRKDDPKKAKNVLIVGIIITIIGIGINLTGTMSGDYVSKYDGLTESQKSTIRIMEEGCDRNTVIAWSQSQEAGKLVEKQCNEAIQSQIESFRNTDARP